MLQTKPKGPLGAISVGYLYLGAQGPSTDWTWHLHGFYGIPQFKVDEGKERAVRVVSDAEAERWCAACEKAEEHGEEDEEGNQLAAECRKEEKRRL